MKVAVTGATGVIGTAAVRALVAAGHDVVGLARSPEKEAALAHLGAESARAGIFECAELVEVFRGCDAVCSLATHVPVGYAGLWPGAWRQNDRLRTDGVRTVVQAAREAGVRRLVQESVSFLYADQGDRWITERSALEINRATEPAAVGESHVQEYQCGSRNGVVLRFGTIVGDDRITRWMLRAAEGGRPVGLGSPDGWAHVVHTDDVGTAVVAALHAPTGVYNVGAEPVRRDQIAHAYAKTAGRDAAEFMGPLLRRLAGPRLEPLTRSLRVSSDHFTSQTGWFPRRGTFDISWLDVIDEDHRAYR